MNKLHNVKLWFAKDNRDNLITINDIDESNKKDMYSCPMCGSDLIPKAIKSKQVTSHFAHVDKTKCNSESMIHWWFKHKFLEKGDSFTVVSDKKVNYICEEVLVEQSYNTGDKIYNPDVTILTECGKTIYFEMAFSNTKKIRDYLDIWLDLKNIVVEVDIKQLMHKDEIPIFNALFYDGKCFNTKRNDTYYNTIGKYKEEKLQSETNDELKSRIKKLDWFWDDVLKYKNGEVDIVYMAEIIDSIHIREKHVVNNVLKKSMCNDLYKEYKSFKTLDDIVKFSEDSVEQSHIFRLLHKVNEILSNENISAVLTPKRCVKYESYYNGSRKHMYKYRPVFSHFEYIIELRYKEKLLLKIGVTNRINKVNNHESLLEYIFNKLKIENKSVKKNCVNCDKNFYIKFTEIDFFIQKELEIPKRCKKCRG